MLTENFALDDALTDARIRREVAALGAQSSETQRQIVEQQRNDGRRSDYFRRLLKHTGNIEAAVAHRRRRLFRRAAR